MNVPSVSAALQSTLLKVGVAILFLCAFFAWHSWDKQKAVDQANSAWALKLEGHKKQQELVTKQLAATAAKEKEQYEAKANDIQRKLNATIVSLRNRPSRPERIVVTEVERACTGRELYREDGEFLAREAARAESVLAERDYCYNAYEEARLKLEQLNGREEQAP